MGDSDAADSTCQLLFRRGSRVLELGSGTGVAGLAVAAASAAKVLLTDRDSLVSLMQLNIDLNKVALEGGDGCAECLAFDWLESAPQRIAETQWDLIVAADLVYSFNSVPLFVNTLAALLLKGSGSRCAQPSDRQPLTAIYAHNPRSDDLDKQLQDALTGAGLSVKLLPRPREFLPVGHISLDKLKKIQLMAITAAPAETVTLKRGYPE